MEVIPAQLAKNQSGDLLMKVQREPVEISQHGKRVAVVISPEEYDQFAPLVTGTDVGALTDLAEGEPGLKRSLKISRILRT